MQKHIPSLYVMAISALAACMALFWWQSQQTNASLLAQNQSFQATLEFQAEQEAAFLQMHHMEMSWDIEAEVQNEHKYSNEGIKDTLLVLRTQTECLMEELEKGQLTQGVLAQHHQWLYDLLAASVPTYEEKFSPFPDQPLRSSVQNKLLLLQWEREVLELMNRRIGPTYCGFGAQVFPSLTQSEDSSLLTVIWGDTLKREVRMQISSEPYYSRQHTHTVFFTSLGYIRQGTPGVGPANLEIPTHDLLAAGENERIVSFSIQTVFKTWSGRKITSDPKPFRLLIVRPATAAYSPPN